MIMTHEQQNFYSAGELAKTQIIGIDGELGTLTAVYFNDLTWHIRYFAVDVGSWLSERIVLIAPEAIGQLDENGIRLNLTREQIRQSPPLATDQPVSREYEISLFDYYQWQPYWYPSVLPGDAGGVVALPPVSRETKASIAEEAHERNRLRSSREVIGYTVALHDGNTATVCDFVIDEAQHKIAYIVADTGGWLKHRPVAIPPTWVQQVDWANRAVEIELSAETIEALPRFTLDKLNEKWSSSIGQ